MSASPRGVNANDGHRRVAFQLQDSPRGRRPSPPVSQEPVLATWLAYIQSVFNISGMILLLALVLTTIGTNVLAGIFYVTVCPYSPERYRRMLRQYCSKWWIDALAFVYPKVRVCITGDSELGGIGASIIVCNQTTSDLWSVLMVARCYGLHGNVKLLLQEKLDASYPLLCWCRWALWWLDFPPLTQQKQGSGTPTHTTHTSHTSHTSHGPSGDPVHMSDDDRPFSLFSTSYSLFDDDRATESNPNTPFPAAQPTLSASP